MTSTIRGEGSPKIDTNIKIQAKMGKKVDRGGVKKVKNGLTSFVNGPLCITLMTEQCWGKNHLENDNFDK